MDELIDSIKNDPGNWKAAHLIIDSFVFNNKITVWYPGNYLFVHIDGYNLSFFQKIKLVRNYRWWCKHAPLSAITGE